MTDLDILTKLGIESNIRSFRETISHEGAAINATLKDNNWFLKSRINSIIEEAQNVLFDIETYESIKKKEEK